MGYYGIVIHHSVCSSINGKGYDFFITKQGSIISSSDQTDPLYLHLCLEGDFSRPLEDYDPAEREQLFILGKLVLKLSQMFEIEQEDVFPHTHTCPGSLFPWSQLVISPDDRYH